MKRAIAISAALALCLSLLSACGKGGEQASEPVQESNPVESAPVESAAVEESQPVESVPAQTGAVDLAAFAQAVLEEHDFPTMNRAEVSAVMLGNYYPGLTDLDLEQVEIYLAMISSSGGELALVQAKDANNAAQAKDIFQARIDAKSTAGPNNDLEEVEVWQRSAQIATNGNYVMLVCHEDSDAIVSEFIALTVDLAAFAQSVQKDHEFPMMNRADPDDEVGAVMLGNYYPGITDLELEQVEIYLATISFSGGELALVQAKDADNAAKAKAVFQARVDSKSEEGPNNYPEEVEIWQRSAQIATNGNYVMLICHEDCDAIVDAFNALFKKFG